MTRSTRVRTALRVRSTRARAVLNPRARFFDRARAFTDVVEVTDRHGNRLFVRTDDRIIGRSLFVFGDFEAHKQENAIAVLRDRGVTPVRVLDLGANIGTTLIELLSLLPEASGVAVEPEHENFRLLSLNVQGNDLSDRVTLHRLALGDKDTTLEFEISPDNRGDHRVKKSGAPGDFGEQHRTSIAVPGRRLDSLAHDGDIVIDHDTLAFIDVQGSEGHLMAGAGDLLLEAAGVALEFWPYGLRRVGGFELFLERLSAFGTIVDITGTEPRPMSYADLEPLAATLTGPADHRDLLLLP